MNHATRILAVLAAWGAITATQANASGEPLEFTTEYGIEFSTIRNPGNRATVPSEVPFDTDRSIGSVEHTYRLARTSLTTQSYFDFVVAYAQFTDATGSGFTSPWIFERGFVGSRDFVIREGADRYPVEADWRFAARYVNWLHNDKATNRDAFETGVYDASTFDSPRETWDVTPSDAARFWIPTRDEWIKGFYYDPNRYGEENDGYWLFPDQGDEPLVPGIPGVGESSVELGGGVVFDVGSYPNSHSAYGLFDASGGVIEWSTGDAHDGSKFFSVGTASGTVLSSLRDRIDFGHGSDLGIGSHGIRIAASVPSPPTLIPVSLVLFSNRRYRK